MSLDERMKSYYEWPYLYELPMRMPVIIRLDGRCFHSFTSKMKRPFDESFMAAMSQVAIKLCDDISGAVFAYTQSDEISILLHNYKKLGTQGWFGNEVQKMASVSAGIASSAMTLIYNMEAVFDSRVFVLPESEVANYFLWRQQDATRNSIQMCAQSMFSHKELHKISCKELQGKMLREKNFNWNDLPVYQKRGTAIYRATGDSQKFIYDLNMPVISQDRDFIDKWLKVEEC